MTTPGPRPISHFRRGGLRTSALLAFTLAATAAAGAAEAAPAESSAFVDDHGVLRWRESGGEVALFGVNYTTPFAHGFRAHRRLGVSWQEAIDADVYHFARLGLDAYRVHVWDREITDAEGNLLENEHVAAFDYLLAALKRRGIKIILTPLQFGNAGYPEPGVPLPGFTSRYGKRGSLEDESSWPLQERYLAQFVRHVNAHTGLAYKDDPDIIAYEICNEPGHWEYDRTIRYINRMVRALREAGCGTPIFYNMSHGLPVFAAYLDADVQGGTFQWYPSNLLAGHEQRGNFLPYVDRYPIPFADDPRFQAKAKMVYEFDAADIGQACIYPAMARTFRTAGMQFAAHFAYDPMFIAPFNTEYQTHYMNLAYAPHKAIALKIAGEAFRRVPRGKSYGGYPDNTQFEGVRIAYAGDVAELVTDEKFFHASATTTSPPHPERLEEIAACGSSPVVAYPGHGAYFLDRLEAGVWRLEVMPDANWVRDPFETSSPRKQVARISWAAWPMEIRLPDLGERFSVTGLNDGNFVRGATTDGTFTFSPGAYLLTRDGVTTAWTRDGRWRNLTLREFVAPVSSVEQVHVLHRPTREAGAGRPLPVAATIVGPTRIEEVRLVYYAPSTPAAEGANAAPAGRPQPGRFNEPGPGVPDTGGAGIVAMEHAGGLDYAAEIPAEAVHPGMLRYHIAVRSGGRWTTFPSRVATLPTDWDFYGEGWRVRVLPPEDPVLLFDAATDHAGVTANHRDLRYELVASDRPGLAAIKVVATAGRSAERDHSFRYFFREQVSGRAADFVSVPRLVLHGRAIGDEPCRVQVALVTDDGVAYGGMIEVAPRFGRCAIDVGDLRPVRAPNIPHGYPVFIPFWSEVQREIPLDLARIESVMVSIGPGMSPEEYDREPGILVERIWLE